MTSITSEQLNAALNYCHETGRLTWKKRTPEMFKDGKTQTAEHKCKLWNIKYSGSVAFNHKVGGYFRGCVFGSRLLAHRVIWCMLKGDWPVDELDHINGVKDDNRIQNLREVDRATNMQNAAIKKNNTSGYCGVSLHKTNKRWVAHISPNGKRIYLGSFPTIESAIAAREDANIKYGFHKNHGRDAA